MSQYFPTPLCHKENIKVEIDLSNYATKKETNDITHVDTSNLKTVYDKLAAKVNNIDTSDYVLKTNFNIKFTKLENKIPNTIGLVKKTDYNTKITEIENKIPSITNLATKTTLTTVENKMPSITGLVKKTDYNTKITHIENILNYHNHDKYVASSEFNTLAANVFNARLS